ncbi:MAG: isochorismatase family protein [Chloroflexi bacterium]|jgi:isochorismate hydrolase|nr:isochorismatase family protein [Chloroflexota bacterium]
MGSVKERYFSSNTIDIQAAQMLHQVSSRPRELALIPKHSALLVLDMQEYFLSPESHAYIPSAAAILPGLQNLIDAFSQRNCPIFFTQHINTPENAAMMGQWWREIIFIENPLSVIAPQFDTRAGVILQKPQYDAFYQTDLDDRLRRLNVSQLVICGVMTHLCCETTARSAFVRGFEIFFPVDGTATYNAVFHGATLTNLAHGFAHLCLIADILAFFESNG